jgi:DNA repair protein RecN (Recombination protein N)
MLIELQIRDFAIIDRLHLRFDEGFHVLTGETGAGKSIIIDALGTLRGDRTDATFVRAGAARARVEGVFSLQDAAHVLPLLRDYDVLDDDESQVILVREISAEGGRSVARINGRAVSGAVLREIGSRLIDIHGQHDGLSLFNPRTHIDMVDRYGELMPLRERVAARLQELRTIRNELHQLRSGEARRQERITELTFLIEDAAQARLRPGEAADLVRERTAVQHAARIGVLAEESYTRLYEGSDGRSGRSVLELQRQVVQRLVELARLDGRADPMAAQAEELLYQLEDLAGVLRTYRLNMDDDPARLDAIEDRLTVIHELERKYALSADDILARAAEAQAEIDRLSESGRNAGVLEAAEAQALRLLAEAAADLSQRRRAVGTALSEQISAAMAALAMPNVRFAVAIDQQDDAAGPLVGGRRVACDRHGVDRLEFLIAPNPGEPLKPLARIASGGESARLLLALKSILSGVDDVPTLVFDEVDIGVGGRAGHVVGQKLWGISAHHQVLCISHLPQVAAFGDAHFHIRKEYDGNRTRTVVTRLSDGQRVEEIAAMLDGAASPHSRANAAEILERAAVWKTAAVAEVL